MYTWVGVLEHECILFVLQVVEGLNTSSDFANFISSVADPERSFRGEHDPPAPRKKALHCMARRLFLFQVQAIFEFYFKNSHGKVHFYLYE